MSAPDATLDSMREPTADPVIATGAGCEALAREIDELLPQTQCGQCGFGGCLPYARALASRRAAVNRCPPGGHIGIARLADRLGVEPIALDSECGVEQPRREAWIDPRRCIGCARCLQVCPVDAIIGVNKWLHAVLPLACTGCDLCPASCPVDCIEMRPLMSAAPWTDTDARAARARHLARQERLARERRRDEVGLEALARREPDDADDAATRAKRAVIGAAIERARRRRAAQNSRPEEEPR